MPVYKQHNADTLQRTRFNQLILASLPKKALYGLTFDNKDYLVLVNNAKTVSTNHNIFLPGWAALSLRKFDTETM